MQWVEALRGKLRKHIMQRAGVAVALFCAALLFPTGTALAHEVRPAVVTVTFQSETRYQIELNANVEAMLAGVSPQHKDTNESPNAKLYDTLRALPPETLRARVEKLVPQLLEGMRLEFDDRRVVPQVAGVDIPPVGDLAISRTSHLRFSGDVPAGAKTVRWSYAAEFGPNVLRLKRQQDKEITAVWLKEGVASEAFPLQGDITPKTRLQLVGEYLTIGFTHIVPKGLDHILFVLGLFLLSARLKPLLVQVTAFTVAHTITLGLTVYGVVSLSPAIVEPLIAASIVYVAIENVLTSKLHAWRPLIVFGFGLLHGMGFAGVLQEVGLPSSEILTGLVAFNVGVELGQLAVITLAFLAVGFWRKNPQWYRGKIVVPASLAIAATGLYWTVERVVG